MPRIPTPSFVPPVPLSTSPARCLARASSSLHACSTRASREQSSPSPPPAGDSPLSTRASSPSPTLRPTGPAPPREIVSPRRGARRSATSPPRRQPTPTPPPPPRRYASSVAEAPPAPSAAGRNGVQDLVDRFCAADIAPSSDLDAAVVGRSVPGAGIQEADSAESESEDEVVFLGETPKSPRKKSLTKANGKSPPRTPQKTSILSVENVEIIDLVESSASETEPDVCSDCQPATVLPPSRAPSGDARETGGHSAGSNVKRRRRRPGAAAASKPPLTGLRGEEVWLAGAWKKVQQAATRASSYSFARVREQAARDLVAYFDEEVLASVLRGRVSVCWNRRLLKTAGVTLFTRSADQRVAKIELSVKVVDDVERLFHTLAHEMCHACQWILDDTSKPPHGKEFKRWARVFEAWDERLSVSTCHNYSIAFRFEYTCQDCGYVYGRHSRSIDTDRKVCGKCRGRLTLRVKKAAEIRAEVLARSAIE